MQIRGAAERSAWRWPAAAAALVAVAAHVPITPTHLREAPYIGWSFVALEITLTALAVTLVLRDSRLVWWAAGVVPALAMLGYAVTRSVALPQIGDDVGNWTQPLGVVALTAEALLILITLGRHARRHPARWLARRPLLWAGLLLAAGLVATDYAVAVGGTG
jgi:peptidoglycan/LPS O-acetylase OafA/YrhL